MACLLRAEGGRNFFQKFFYAVMPFPPPCQADGKREEKCSFPPFFMRLLMEKRPAPFPPVAILSRGHYSSLVMISPNSVQPTVRASAICAARSSVTARRAMAVFTAL